MTRAAAFAALALVTGYASSSHAQVAYADPACCDPIADVMSLDECGEKLSPDGYMPDQNGCGAADASLTNVPIMFVARYGVVDFTPGCNGHDKCYGTCNSIKHTCDANLLNDLSTACAMGLYSPARIAEIQRAAATKPTAVPLVLAGCFALAAAFYGAVDQFGQMPWENGQVTACWCCDGCDDGTMGQSAMDAGPRAMIDAGGIGTPGADSEVVMSGTIQSGEVLVYSFDAEAGQTVIASLVDTQGNDFMPAVEIYDSVGKELAWAKDAEVAQREFRFTADGSYELRLVDVSGKDVMGQYTLYVVVIPGSNEGGALRSGRMLSGTIDAGDLDSYTVTAEHGESLLLRVVDVAMSGFKPAVTLYKPDGSRYITNAGADVAAVEGAIPTTGTYTVVVSDSSGVAQAGDYELYFVHAPGAVSGGSLKSGVEKNGTLDAGELDSYTFDTQDGDHVELVVTNESGGDLVPLIDIYDPSGAHLAWGTSPTTVTRAVSSAVKGTYTVVVSDSSSGYASTGAYQLLYTRTPAQP